MRKSRCLIQACISLWAHVPKLFVNRMCQLTWWRLSPCTWQQYGEGPCCHWSFLILLFTGHPSFIWHLEWMDTGDLQFLIGKVTGFFARSQHSFLYFCNSPESTSTVLFCAAVVNTRGFRVRISNKVVQKYFCNEHERSTVLKIIFCFMLKTIFPWLYGCLTHTQINILYIKKWLYIIFKFVSGDKKIQYTKQKIAFLSLVGGLLQLSLSDEDGKAANCNMILPWRGQLLLEL